MVGDIKFAGTVTILYFLFITGDVDSGDNDSDRRSNCSAASQLQTYSELRHAPHGTHSPLATHGPRAIHGPLALDDYERRRRRKPATKPETKL